MTPLFAIAIFAAATLLFVVQPLAGRVVLPLLGGSPAVWTTCMVFFQALLLLGYLYAHLITTRLRARTQAILHTAVLLAAGFTLPFSINVPEPSGSPVLWLLRTLLTVVGPAFFVVSATGPLLQRWFSLAAGAQGRDPYFLSIASNAGSAVGLLAYPLVIERELTRQGQAQWWSAGYWFAAACIAACAIAMVRRTPNTETDCPLHAAPPATSPSGSPWRLRFFWLVLAAAPSSLMLGVTQHITTDIAAAPLLWVAPLLLYLITFMLAFARRWRISASLLGRILPGLLVILAVVLLTQSRTPAVVIIALHLLTFFIAALMCHTRLADARPGPERLTEFFLVMSAGGVVGGLFNALIAPNIFASVTEYPLILGAICFLRPQLKDDARGGAFMRRSVALTAGAVLFLLVVTLDLRGVRGALWSWGEMLATGPLSAILSRVSFEPRHLVSAISVGLPAAAALFLILRHGSLRFACAALGLLLATEFTSRTGRVIYSERTFFGVHAVLSNWHEVTIERPRDGDRAGFVRWHTLMHGTTMHGVQAMRGAWPGDGLDDDPRVAAGGRLADAFSQQGATYYHPSGPAGDVMRMLEKSGKLDTCAFIGLGSGSMAAYAQAGSRFRFFEIDPAVKRIAEDATLFTYVTDARARGADIQIEVVDGRVGAARLEDASQRLLLLDAFSSDAIPVHLLTLEAFRIYLAKLKPDGLVAVHVSNRYFELRPLITRLGRELGLVIYWRSDDFLSPDHRAERKNESEWLILARDADALGWLAKVPNWQRVESTPADPLWTDDYSNVIDVFLARTAK